MFTTNLIYAKKLAQPKFKVSQLLLHDPDHISTRLFRLVFQTVQNTPKLTWNFFFKLNRICTIISPNDFFLLLKHSFHHSLKNLLCLCASAQEFHIWHRVSTGEKSVSLSSQLSSKFLHFKQLEPLAVIFCKSSRVTKIPRDLISRKRKTQEPSEWFLSTWKLIRRWVLVNMSSLWRNQADSV